MVSAVKEACSFPARGFSAPQILAVVLAAQFMQLGFSRAAQMVRGAGTRRGCARCPSPRGSLPLGDGGVCRRRPGVLHLHGGGLQGGARVHRRLHLLVDASQGPERELRRGDVLQTDQRLGVRPMYCTPRGNPRGHINI